METAVGYAANFSSIINNEMDKGYNLFNKWLIEHYKQGFCDAFSTVQNCKDEQWTHKLLIVHMFTVTQELN